MNTKKVAIASLYVYDHVVTPAVHFSGARKHYIAKFVLANGSTCQHMICQPRINTCGHCTVTMEWRSVGDGCTYAPNIN